MTDDLPSDNIPEDMDLDYATSIADRARALMAQHAVAPTADNFAVWYQYVLGTNPAFNKTIDVVISNKRPFDKRVNWGLVEALRKAQGGHGAIGIVTDHLNDVLGKATSYLAKAAADNQAHAEKLGGVAAQVESGCDPLAIIGDLTSELSRAALRAAALETQFVATSKELEEVRSSLKLAERCAKTDPLTGLANRRALDEYLHTAQIKTMEHGVSLSVMLLDIDRFKQFNDNFGHQLGDHVLRLIAGVLRNGLRQDDLAARYGGEELVALLPGADLSVCKEIAERIRKTIADRQIVRRATGEAIARVTVSIGIARFVPGETVADLFERCDRALYLAKNSGRNRTVTESDLHEEIDMEPVAAA